MTVTHATFHLERHLTAPLPRIWAALTDPAAKPKWFAGPPGQSEQLERHIDIREGGTEILKGRFASGLITSFQAFYHDVVPEKRLVYSYIMHLDGKKISASLATLQLTPEPGGTNLAMTEQGAFLDGYEDSGSREQGSGHLLDALAAALAS